MKIKTNELIDLALDWAVAKANGVFDFGVYAGYRVINGQLHLVNSDNNVFSDPFAPSTNWSQGDLIINREHICSFFYSSDEDGQPCKPGWEAYIKMDGVHCTGPTQLIATMRCFVATVLGDEIEVPDALQ